MSRRDDPVNSKRQSVRTRLGSMQKSSRSDQAECPVVAPNAQRDVCQWGRRRPGGNDHHDESGSLCRPASWRRCEHDESPATKVWHGVYEAIGQMSEVSLGNVRSFA
jgi:hypothetical protein